MSFSGSSSEYMYAPDYIFILLLFLGLLFFGIFLYCLLTIKFNAIGFGFLIISIVTYLLVGIYMVGSGYYYDTDPREGHIFREYGFLELILLTYPYIFLTLACSIGQKRKN